MVRCPVRLRDVGTEKGEVGGESREVRCQGCEVRMKRWGWRGGRTDRMVEKVVMVKVTWQLGEGGDKKEVIHSREEMVQKLPGIMWQGVVERRAVRCMVKVSRVSTMWACLEGVTE